MNRLIYLTLISPILILLLVGFLFFFFVSSAADAYNWVLRRGLW